MQINTETGLLDECKQRSSPNKDVRPEGIPIELVVIHSISLPPGVYDNDSVELFFQNKLDKSAHPYFEEIHQMQVSSHIFIKRDGEVIQFVPFHQRAWHAGKSCYKERECCNDFSIGIELEGTDVDNFKDIQYEKLAKIVSSLQKNYPKINDNITGHSEIAPGRKTDPGTGFNWEKFHQILTTFTTESSA